MLLEAISQSIQYRSNRKAEDRVKMKICECNSAQNVSLIEIPTATLPCISLSLATTKFMALSPPVIPVMGCNPGGAVSVY